MSLLLDEITGQIRRDCRRRYLDNAAMSLQPRRVTEALEAFHRSRQERGPDFAAWWGRADDLRALAAEIIGAASDEVLLLQNTSMGINLAAGAIPFEAGDNVLITDSEFPSNAYPWFNLESRGVEVRVVPNRGGRFPVEAFADRCDGRTRAVSVSWVVSATGAVLDIAALGRMCRERGAFFVVDAIQGLGAVPWPAGVRADFVVSGFFKWLQGPDGLAFAAVNRDRLPGLRVPFAGWAGMRDRFDYSAYRFDLADEARRFETGNLNFSGVYGAAAALELLRGERREIERRVARLTGYLLAQARGVPGLRILSPEEGPRSGITLFAPADPEGASRRLEAAGIVVNRRAGGLRVSPHYYNDERDLNLLLEAVT